MKLLYKMFSSSFQIIAMTEERETQLKKKKSNNESTLEDEFEEYLKKDIPESQPED